MKQWHTCSIDDWQQIPATAGVYLIQFDGTPYAYVGSSKNIRRRISQHRKEMRYYRHSMYEAFLSSQHIGIRVTILENVDNLERLAELETDWITLCSSGLDDKLLNRERCGKRHHSHRRQK